MSFYYFLPGACTGCNVFCSFQVWLGSGDNASFWELKNEQLDQPILEMLASAGLDDEGQQKALNTVKEYYFKTGGYDKKSFINVTDVSGLMCFNRLEGSNQSMPIPVPFRWILYFTNG